MKKAMKKITYLLIAAITLVCVASCVKELTPEPVFAEGVEQEFTVSLPADTRTAQLEGKTVWTEGDSLWVYNGIASEVVIVPEEAWGLKEFSFVVKTATLSDTTKTLYVVYPYTAVAGVTDGKVKVKIPAVQDGTFANANIAAAVSENYTIALKNVTAVIKVTVPENTKAPVYSLAFGAANGNPLTGTCTVDFSGAAPVLTPVTASSSASIQVDGLAQDFYLAVIPGTFEPGFKLTAATTDFQYASQTKETTVANTLAVNDLVDLGPIGTELKSLEGDGTEASPWLVESLGHIIAISSAVDEGNSFEGGCFKVVNDIAGIATPIGSDIEEPHPFCGDFDGNGQTLTLDLNGTNNLGLFGLVGGNANIHNVKLAGTVVSSSNCVAALAGQIYAAEDAPVTIKDVVSDASVSGASYVGGIVGYSTTGSAAITIDHCTNNGSVTATSYRVGGIVGGMLATTAPKTIKDCTNNGPVKTNSFTAGGIVGHFVNAIQDGSGTLPETARVKNVLTGCTNTGSVQSLAHNGNHYYRYKVDNQSSTYINNYTVGSTDRGTGGIVGYAAQTEISNCVNSGAVSAVNKAGGIAGFTVFADVDDSQNSGNVSVTSYLTGSVRHEGLAGGIVGSTLGSDHIRACKNSGDIYGYASVGGIIGFAMGGNANGTANKPATSVGNAAFVVDNCLNVGKVRAKYAEVGGIAGVCYALNGTNKGYVKNSTNEGAVVSDETKAGGIVGVLIDDTGWSRPSAEGCVNKGPVTAKYWVGGIVGYGAAIARMHTSSGSNVGLTTHRFYITNCENHGTVLGNRSDDGGEVAGGIMGSCFFGSNADTREYMGIEIYNCLNAGDVLYAEAGHKKPYCGGIVGRFGRGCIYNTANTGRVGPAAGTPAEGADAYLGSVIGSLEATGNRICKVVGAYSMEGTADIAFGSKSTPVNPEPTNVSTFNKYGELSSTVTVNGEDCYFVDDALNAWVNNRPAYFNWVFGSNIGFNKN